MAGHNGMAKTPPRCTQIHSTAGSEVGDVGHDNKGLHENLDFWGGRRE